MLGFLKKKLSKVVESFSKKAEERESEEAKPVVPEQPKAIEEPKPVEQPQVPPQPVAEETQPKVEEIPDTSKETPEDQIREIEMSAQNTNHTELQTENKFFDQVPEKIEEKIEQPQHIIPEIEKKSPQTLEETKPREQLSEKQMAAIPKEIEQLPEKKSWIKKVVERVSKVVTEKTLSEGDVGPILEELKIGLSEADVALPVAEKITEDLKKNLVGKPIKRGKIKDEVKESLRQSLTSILSVGQLNLLDMVKQKKPVTIIFLGFNGAGKTTSLAKTASWLISKGHTCVFAAADTFRAAAEEQLEIHGYNLKVNVIKHQYGADPAAVIYDAIWHAKSKNIDFVLADTAGRSHTNANLMDQLKKIVRVNKPDVKILVIDSLAGNDALIQARMFNEIGVDAVIFTKVDVNEKGGAILSVTHELNKPILFLGLGQDYNNLEPFDSVKFVNNLLE